MKLGIYLNAQHPEGDDPARRFAEMVEQVRLIRSLGFDSIWSGEHHATPGFHYFPLLPMPSSCAGLPPTASPSAHPRRSPRRCCDSIAPASPRCG
jgi:alkanesulfonate monooxygenase SsuD/methylene tetrahydromethanopterin reductase-like flavin-dependent oxidoreductase (luciferase family)